MASWGLETMERNSRERMESYSLNLLAAPVTLGSFPDGNQGQSRWSRESTIKSGHVFIVKMKNIHWEYLFRQKLFLSHTYHHQEVVVWEWKAWPGLTSSLFFPQDSASKLASISGGKPATPNSSILRKTPGPKARVGPSVSCLRRNSDSRNLTSDRAVSPQRIRRVSSSGKSQITQLCCRAARELFRFTSVPSGTCLREAGFGSRTLVHCVTKALHLAQRR